MNELNKKLAERAGFRLKPTTRSLGTIDWPDYSWHTPEGEPLWDESLLPDFEHDPTACFKWLINPREDILRVEFSYRTRYPELEVGCRITMRSWHPDRTKGRVAFNGVAPKDKPALALCKAFEKLTDSEAK